MVWGLLWSGERAFLCLEMTPHLPHQPVRQVAGTQTGQFLDK